MPDSSHIVILNDGLERRQRRSGKEHYTVTIRSEPIIHNLDPKLLGAGPAAAIAALLRERIAGITTLASKATQRARVVAAKAFAAGQLWAVKRYAGGRTGPMAPNQSDRLFNDSGRFAAGIAARATQDGWTINVPTNRLDPSTLSGGESALQAMWAKLVALVPELANPETLMDSIPVRKAIAEGLDAAIMKARATEENLKGEAIGRLVEIGAKVIEIAEAFAGA